MSDIIQHECGLALIRLLKPLSFYQEKYGTSLYGLNNLQLLMQKQRNRGQDGAGVVTIKMDMHPGQRYISRKRSNGRNYLKEVFEGIHAHFDDCSKDQLADPEWLKINKPYTGELLLGHLRYGTHGKNTIETVHPFLRQNNWISRNLALAGNFNLTNVEELFSELIGYGQYPKERSDTVTVLEKIGHFLDDEVQRLHSWFKPEGYNNQEINTLICEHLDVRRLLQRACRKFDGGYVMAGLIGHGDAFVLRDPVGIRPAFYYYDDEIVVAASERPAIQTVCDVNYKEVKELQRGHALIIKKNGKVSEELFRDQEKRQACSFERIYFSRGTDRDIYLERKNLGKQLAEKVLESVEYDVENTIISFIPNTAETAFLGLVEGVHEKFNQIKKKRILELKDDLNEENLEKILKLSPRVEKIAVKDAKLRTFIADDVARGEMVSHVYDVTYGIVRNHLDNLVLVDDSIVRGTTLRDSILQIVARLKPKKIIIVSSSPQIRFPDCYGIDMSRMNDFAAFRALVSLLKEAGKENKLEEVYELCKIEEQKPADEIRNMVKTLYNEFSYEMVSSRIAELLTPKNIGIEVEIIFQTIDGLHKACPNHTGDWYFSGNYPTVGGNRIVNRAYMNFMENKNVRAYH
jgi:amidophosphoribosyltransferase